MTPEQPDGPAPPEDARPAPPEAAPAAPPPEPAPEGPPGPAPAPPRRGRGALVLAACALVLALVAIAGVAGVGWAWYQVRGEQARIAELEGRVAGLDGRLAALAQSAASASAVARLSDRLAAAGQARRSDLQAVRAALDGLSARVAGGSERYREDEAAALLRLAQARLELAHDPDAAGQALKLADAALAGLADPGLAPVRAAIANEIAAVQAAPRPDVEGAYLRLAALAGGIERLPLAGSRTVAPPVASAPASGWSWRGIGQAFQRAFAPLVVVRHGPVARPLLPPREAYFVRANLRLDLAGAQLALLERDGAAYRAALGRAQVLLREWFVAQDPAVVAMGRSLAALAALNPAPALPQLGAARRALAAARAGAAHP